MDKLKETLARQNKNLILQILLLLLPAVVLLSFFWVKANNIPVNDDFCTLTELAHLIKSTGLDFWKGIFDQFAQGDYRHAVMRVIGLLLYYVGGPINLKIWTFVNHIFLIIASYLVIFMIAPKDLIEKKKIYFLLPASIFLFSPTYMQVVLFMTGSSTHILGISLSIIALMLLTIDENKYFIWSIVVTCLSIMHVSGLAVFIVGILTLFLQRRFKHLTAWLFICGFISAVHYLTLDSSKSSTIFDVNKNFDFIFYFIGGFLAHITPAGESGDWPNKIGMLIFLWSIYFCVKRVDKKNMPLLALSLFILLLAILGSLKRAVYGPTKAAMSGYSLHGLFLLSALYIGYFHFTIDNKKRVIWFGSFLILSFSLIYNSYFYPVRYLENKNWLVKYYSDFPKQCLLNGYFLAPNQGQSSLDLEEFKELNLIDTTEINNYLNADKRSLLETRLKSGSKDFLGFFNLPDSWKARKNLTWLNDRYVLNKAFELPCFQTQCFAAPATFEYQLTKGHWQFHANFGQNKNETDLIINIKLKSGSNVKLIKKIKILKKNEGFYANAVDIDFDVTKDLSTFIIDVDNTPHHLAFWIDDVKLTTP